MIPVAKPWIGEAEWEAVRRPLLSGWLTQGSEVAAFEREFADYVGAGHACAVSNCTTALHLALLAAGVRHGDEVITVSHSFIATANAVRYCGATPVFVDIQPNTYNIDPSLIREAFSERTRAVLCVHQMGMPCDLQGIVDVANSFGVPVVEDAACAVGSEIFWQGRWEKIGRPHGAIACFSFHPRKLLTTGEGGMITTSNAEWDRSFRLWRHQGMDVSDAVRHEAKQVLFETYPCVGYNYRMTDIQAAIGREQLKRIPEIVGRRRSLAKRYSDMLRHVPEIRSPREPEYARSNWQSYCVRLADCDKQTAVMQQMLDAGVATRRGIMCAHREPAYREEKWTCARGTATCDCGPATCSRLSGSEGAQDTGIILPLYHQMTESEQDRVVEALRQALSAVRDS